MPNYPNILRLLAVLHFGLAGLTALFSCLPLVQLVVAGAVLSRSGAPGGAAVEMYVGMAALAASVLAAWALAVCLVLTGVHLWRRLHRTFCLVMSGVECIVLIPLGTALGAVTIWALTRPKVRQLFREAAEARLRKPEEETPEEEEFEAGYAMKAVFDTVGGPDWRLSDNCLQAVAIGVFTMVGALAGAWWSSDNLAGGVMGGITGMIGGLIISGAILGIVRLILHALGRHD
jgi:NADPH:quinone reductase-like Zn-dependent oxidoreductase